MTVQGGETDNKVSPLFYYIVSILLNDKMIEGGKEWSTIFSAKNTGFNEEVR